MSECTHKRYVEDVHGYCPDCGEVRPSVSHRYEERIAELEAENNRYRNGYKGGCWTCESVGELNVKLEAENQRLREAIQEALAAVYPMYYREFLKGRLLGGGE